MKHILLVACLFYVSVASAQTDSAKKDPNWQYVERMPNPDYDLAQYLKENIHYPDAMKKAGIEGKVVVRFIVNKDGHIGDAIVARGIGGGCDEEALRVVEKMPNWIPGEQSGKKVEVNYTLPVIFKL